MDGLIPMAFRAIKKNRTRRRYECLSAGAAQSYDVSDFFLAGKPNCAASRLPTDRNMEFEGGAHRRRWSVGDFSSMSCREGRAGGYDISYGGGGAIEGGSSPPRPRQLVRFRSQRLFSCVSGA